ncbi:TetR/AcrR family transcriptional regulator [Nocardia donostiensis]|uniref:TetR family transcriptional regulator n=1 Tax=Nocardia donostiensis TaxID=1538463 RepID=A0A1W0AXH4_9NOCA|nr:TetR/AcrR family transcriptional regulator [Nocardia donostiensis]ONM46199.1 TetR family transcriptional regulator [Nocardia donostiensis]OQS14919.1 TetR family transcriptional regulator [Nocardia donostiensis]OQS18249.1 TetR family transcriptional regulator [Nocardia donostiensis]
MSTARDDDERLTPAAQRILDTASQLFYSRGIHAVGVDTIAAESGVTKRTLYDRFGSKDGLLVTYLEVRDRRWRELVDARLAEHDDPVRRLLVPFDVLPEWLPGSSRGCSFINAFAELPEPDHPGRQVIVDEKTWLRDLFCALLAEAGAAEPDLLAVQLLSLHEGAIVSYAITDEHEAPAAVRRAAETLIAQALGK